MFQPVRLGAFAHSLKEVLIAYSFDMGGLLAGFMVASQLGIFRLSPWAIAMYPAIISAKGVIGGLLSGHLGTALHLGTIYPRFFNNTKHFYQLYKALVVVTLVTSVMMSLVSLVFGLVFWGITLADFLAILLTVIATMSIGLILTLVTIYIAFVTFKKGLDPDILVYPIMSTIADVFITICYIVVLNMFFLTTFGIHALTLIAILHLIAVFLFLAWNYREENFIRTVKESLFTMIFVAFIVNITGSVLKRVSTIIEDKKEIYTVYPALIDMIGDVGSVIGSTATTKLALGAIKPALSSMKQHAMQIASAWTASIIIASLLAAVSLLMNGAFTLLALFSLTLLLLVTTIIAAAAITLLAYGISILTFRKGLDPDNFVIPLESTFADSLTSIALLVALALLGQAAG